MKNKKLWYIGYLIALISLISAFLFKGNRTLEIIFIFVFSCSLRVSYVNIKHNNMLEKDRKYRIMVNDERAEKIRDKVNSSMCRILIFINSIIAIVSLILRENISAILLLVVIFISPFIMIFINKYFEKKY